MVDYNICRGNEARETVIWAKLDAGRRCELAKGHISAHQ